MSDHRYVEVTRAEAEFLRRVCRGADPAAAILDTPEVNRQRLADRFEIAETTTDAPSPMMGKAVVIARAMS